MPLTECAYCREMPGRVPLPKRFPAEPQLYMRCSACRGTGYVCNLCRQNPCDEDCGKAAIPDKGNGESNGRPIV